jgi:hypothetical protein
MSLKDLGRISAATLGLFSILSWAQNHSLRFKESGCYRASGKVVKSSSSGFSLEVLPGTRSQSIFQIQAPNLHKRPKINSQHEMALFVELKNGKAELSTPAALLSQVPLDSKTAQSGIEWTRPGKDLASCL